jgi:lipopolysaccharide biosynthesis regulator YciM
VFEEMRTRVSQQTGDTAARERLHRGLEHLLGGNADAAIVELQAAAVASGFRFTASAQLGRIFLERGDVAEAIAWLQRAAESPAPSPDEERAVGEELAAARLRLPRVDS